MIPTAMDQTPPPNPSQQLLEHISSYWISQIIGVVARLRLADLLASGPLSSDALAPRVGANPDGLYRLMRAGVVAGLFTEVPPRTFTLTPLGAGLRSEVPGSMHDMAIMMTAPGHWRPGGDLFTAVQPGRSPARGARGRGRRAATRITRPRAVSSCRRRMTCAAGRT